MRADGPFERAIVGALDAPARKKAVSQLQAAARNPQDASLVTLLKIRPDSINLLRVAQTNTASIVTVQAHSLTSAAQSDEADWLAITVGSVMLAIALLWLTNRWITRPLRALADQAAEMAGKRLPAAVQEILQTPVNESVVHPDVEPVRVKAGGEVHDVEVALNKVQNSAVSLAVEQATLRRNIADAYVNLGRRNQNLLSRQLEFITQLENDESDPETLEHLFRLDHLATRMRRNAESLLVLAGLAPPRTWSAAVAMGDVVRGALGEVEGYRRVRLRHVDDARVDGAAAADVSHVIAELVENALSFSPPDADVEVYGRRDEHGYVITIVDSGIGMHDEELERANALISSASALTLAPSRFLGHYVVAQLASRHGLAVHLAASPAGGLTAMIALPAELIGMKREPAVVAPDNAASLFEPAADPSERPPLALPRRGSAPEARQPGSSSDRDARGSGATDLVPRHIQRLRRYRLAARVRRGRRRGGRDRFPRRNRAGASTGARTPHPRRPRTPRPSLRRRSPPNRNPRPRRSRLRSPPPRRLRPRVLASDSDRSPTCAERCSPPRRPTVVSEAPAADPDPSASACRRGVGARRRRPGPAPGARPRSPRVVRRGGRGRRHRDRRAPAEPASPFSEDLIPQRLPKRGRRNSKLETPWVRQRPAGADERGPWPARTARGRARSCDQR